MREIRVKSVLNKHKKRDSWFLDDYSVNPYEGCSFNCTYCYIRGSKYVVNMEKALTVKVNAPEILWKQLRKRGKMKEYGFISLSSSTEPYMPIEQKLKLTRRLLQIILHHRFPVHVITKSTLILRDIDLLKEIDSKAVLPPDLTKIGHGVIVSFSLSTIDGKLAKIFEPNAPTPEERLETLRKCREEGLFAGVAYIPVLPYLSDGEEELEEMVKTAKEYDASFILVGALTLFGNKPEDSRAMYYNVLQKHFPHLIQKYNQIFSDTSYPSKQYQEKLRAKTVKLCRKYRVKYGINQQA